MDSGQREKRSVDTKQGKDLHVCIFVKDFLEEEGVLIFWSINYI